MLKLDWRLALLVIAFAPLPAITAMIATPEQTRRERTLLDRWAKIYSRFNEVLSGIVTVRSFALEDMEKQRFLREVAAANAVVVTGVRTDSTFTAASNMAVALARIATICGGGWLIVRGQITVGTLVALLGYVGGLFGPVQDLSGVYQALQKASVSLDEIFGILDVHDRFGDAPNAIEVNGLKGAVAFDSVSSRHRRRAPGSAAVQRQCPQQHRVRPGRGDDGGRRGGGARRQRDAFLAAANFSAHKNSRLDRAKIRRNSPRSSRVGCDRTTLPMTSPHAPELIETPLPMRLTRHVAHVGAFALFASLSLAQTVPPSAPAAPAAEEEVVELSPFVTTAATDKGYVATSSLAGSRVNTPLKDIAAQIDVMTLEFLNDIGATNMEEAVAFTTNNGGANEQNTGPNDGILNTRAGGRARGFDAITQSADFYETSLPSEFYNVERVTIANGPQSILFGLGNAGGAIDISTKRALMRNRGEVTFRTDNNGSLRSTLDVNRQLIPKTLAVRVAAVRNDNKSYVEDAFNRQKRIFGSVTYKPFTRTTVRVSAERVGQRASNASNYLAYDFVTPWIAAGSPLYDNSAGNASVTAAAYPLLNRNTSALRVVSYGATDPSVLVWNGSAITRGPNQLAGAGDTRNTSLIDNSIYPTERDVRVGGRLNRLHGKLLRGAIEQRITNDLFVELGFNYESVAELQGGAFQLAEALNIFADPNRYLPGGTAAARQTALNPNAGKLYIESYPTGTESRSTTKEGRLTTSYEFDFAKHFNNTAAKFGRHRIAGLVSSRVDEDRSQDSRAMILGSPSFVTGDLLNNSRFVRSRYYLDPASGIYTARALPGGSGQQDSGWFGPWTFTDSVRGESFQATMFDHPDGRSSAATGARKEINTYMLALQSFFLRDRLNLFAGHRLDQFKNYLIDPAFLVRGDQSAPGDRRGLYTPLSRTTFESTPTLDDEAITSSYGGVFHATRWLSVFASKSDNTALPPRFLDANGSPLPGISSDGYDFGFRVSLRQDDISLRVNFYKEHQKNLIGDGQDVRNASNDIEQRLRGTDRPADIADVPADGYDPVTRGNNAYRSVEDKIGRGLDATLVARITRNWDARLAVGQQKTKVYNKGADFHRWVERRLPVWQQFGGLGWDNVTISPTDPRTVHQYYTEDVEAEILRDQLRNALPRFRQRQWRASLFTNYRVTEGLLRGFNIGGGVRWTEAPVTTGYFQRQFPDGRMGDDVTRPIGGDSQTFVDLLMGYGGRTKFFGGKPIGWRLQLNVRNLLDNDDIERLRSSWVDGGRGLHWGRVEPRQVVLTSSFTF